jgi:hypothetical protein
VRANEGGGGRGGAVAWVFAAALLVHAPYQCGRSPDRARREETPGEALYSLAQKLRDDGDERGYRTTLRYIVTRYPSSRFAVAAQLDLGEDASDADAP